MKTRNSMKNSIASIFTNLVTIIIGLIAQAIFIKILGTEYLGINGLFTNIISMLGIVELGIGSAIIYNLYKPIVNNDIETIKSLMNFYKNAYNLIAIIVLGIGLLITPFLNLFIENVTVNINLEIVYILFILDIVASYLLSYKRSILYADQRNYTINIVHIIYLIILNFLQIMILYLTKNYYLYLIIKIVMRIFENVIIKIIVNRKYSYIKDHNIKPLDVSLKKDIIKKVKALFFHKIAYFTVMCTDNMIISKYFGIVTVGLYSNYYMIINAVQVLFGQAITALTPSVGNLLVENNKIKNYNIFKKIRFINFWIATFTGISLLIVMRTFIIVWIGEEYLISNFVLIVLVINFYQKMMRNCYMTFKEAAGIFYEDRFVPIMESILNVVASIILLKFFGLAGVFMGTIVSGFVIWGYSFPKYVYKNLFNRKYILYIKETIGYLLLFIIILSGGYFISTLLIIGNLYLQLLINILISLIIPNIILVIIFYNTEEFKYYLDLLKKILKRKNTFNV